MAQKRAQLAPIEDLDADDYINELFDPNDPAIANDPLIQIILHLYDTVNTLISDINTNNNQVDMLLVDDTDIDTMLSDITTNKAKTGITTSQANAITANTAKTGITTSQANAITANTAKTGISTSQTQNIRTNTIITEKVSNLTTASKNVKSVAADFDTKTGVYTFTIVDGNSTT